MDAKTKIDQYIASVTDWRGDTLEELRKLILASIPEVNEEFKWGVPVFSGNKLICAISAFKDFVKINFFQGAQLDDNDGVFNSGLDSKDHRSVNIGEGETIKTAAITDLIKQAAKLDKA